MKSQITKKSILLIVAIIAVVALMFGLLSWIGGQDKPAAQLKKFDDVRYFVDTKHPNKIDVSNMDLKTQKGLDKIIPFVRFNNETKWPSAALMPTNINPTEILEIAKTPGLGVKDIHVKGITGKGVGIGIIDQPIYTNHPEYKEKIVAYKKFGETDIAGSSVGSATVSIVAGENCGVAPGAKIYYAAVAVDKLDVQYYVDAVNWFILLNSTLSKNDKIKIIVVPAALDGIESPFTKNQNLWAGAVKKAEANNIIILDCSSRNKFGSCWLDIRDIDNVKNAKPGYANDANKDVSSDKVLVPTGPRSVAEEYQKGVFGYQYVPVSGASWTAPYAAGLMALAIQKSNNTDFNYDKLFELMYQSAHKEKVGYKEYRIVNPKKFISLVK